jgi:hypothetical protein
VSGEGKKALLFFAGVGVLALLGVLAGPRVLGLFAGPEVQIVSALKATEPSTLQVAVKGAQPLVLHRHYFERILVNADLASRRADAVATLDAEGRLGETKVSSLGFERIPFVHDGGAWKPEGAWAPRLAAALAALEARRRALEQGDLETLGRLGRAEVSAVRADEWVSGLLTLRKRQVRAEAWYLRSERDGVLVSEDFRVLGETPDRPVDERGTRQFVLEQDGTEFFFAAGLM